MTDRTGTTLGKYRLMERLGEGGMGTVYRARDEMLDRDIAIKVLRPDLLQQPALVERFRTEAVALARLAHPGIATLYGLERDGDELYMVMEFLRGETLEGLVHREGRLSWRRAADICARVAEALDHAHAHGVIHRDIKPANIMIDPRGDVKVMDFGIARMAGSNRQTRHGHAVGTPAYMAPEQLRGEACDGRTDLYALGAVFYELITGRVAFDADSDYRLMMQQLHDPPPRPSASQPDIPPLIDQAVLCAMAKEPDDRFASAAAMRNALVDAGRSVVREPSATSRWIRPGWSDWPSRLVPRLRDLAGRVEPRGRWPLVAGLALMVVVAAWPRSPHLPGANPTPIDDGTPPRTATLPTATGSVRAVEPARFVPPPPAPAGAPNDAPPNDTPVKSRNREGRPAPTSPPAAAPPTATPSLAAPAATEARADAAIAAALDRWFEGIARRQAPGVDGFLAGQSVAVLVREGRLAIDPSGAPTITVTGDRATATVTRGVQVRSAFGASKKLRGRFRFVLAQGDGGAWRVTRVGVAE
jgi:serine/threonine-protein kinase